MNNHKHAIIFNHSPFTNDKGKEGLELALTLATYEQSVALFFTGNAPLQLSTQIAADKLNRKNYSQGFKALDLYDIEEVYVDQTAMELLQLQDDNLAIEAQLLSAEAFLAKLSEFDVVLEF